MASYHVSAFTGIVSPVIVLPTKKFLLSIMIKNFEVNKKGAAPNPLLLTNFTPNNEKNYRRHL
jgi:hypothetical protein